MSSVTQLNSFYKGPITSCEYISNDKLLIGYGPYLSLIDENTSEELAKLLALKYRVIHKIVPNPINQDLCVFGQKAFNIIQLDKINNKLDIKYDNACFQLNDWIFDILYLSNDQLIIVCAHNQCFLFKLDTASIERKIECNQKCMLYSAKIINLNNTSQFEDVLVVSGTIYNQILIWSPTNGRTLFTLEGHQGVIFNLEFSYETNFLFSCSDDRSVNVWELELETNPDSNLKTIKNYKLNNRFYGHDARVWKCLSFIDKETNIQYLCSVGEDLNCCLWNVNEKTLLHRFNAMKKGFKNIWSLSLNFEKMQLATGWSDGGLRKLLLDSYLVKKQSNEQEANNYNQIIEWNIKYDNEKDFIRNIIFLNEKILCCTNMGCLYLIDAQNYEKDRANQQKFIFKSVLLSGYNCMTKIQVDNDFQHYYLAIGTLKGFIYILNLKISEKDEITMECVNSMSMEEELAEKSLYSAATSQPKISNLQWCRYKDNETGLIRYFLLASFGFIEGLMHLYEFLPESFKINLIGRLFLPVCKHRWFTAYSVILIKKPIKNNDDYDYDEFISSNKQIETFHLVIGDKCGNLYYYKLDVKKNRNEGQENLNESEETNLSDYSFDERIKIVKPVESAKNLTKDNSSISAIYTKCLLNKTGENTYVDELNYLIICCAKDGFYRVFELSNIQNINDDSIDETDCENAKEEPKNANIKPASTSLLKSISKHQINSYIDIIESLVYDDEINQILKKNKIVENNEETNQFGLESNLRLGFCFYGDKFLLWSFQSNRSLFDLKCGGANRSWDYEFSNFVDSTNKNSILFRFIYVKNKNVEEARNILNINEINRPKTQLLNNHFCQIFHGNTMTSCKHILNSDYLITGSEDTQLIVTKIDRILKNNNEIDLSINHQFHLQGHDSVIKCFDYIKLNSNELLIVSAGGKANIKLWKVVINSETQIIKRIVHLYEFKRFKMRNSNRENNNEKSGDKPWLYIDLKSNPDIRFMDVYIKRSNLNQNEFIIPFACSDGCLRIFKYQIETNRLLLVNKFTYPKCLIGIKQLEFNSKSYSLCFGTDGNILIWELDIKLENESDNDQKEDPIKLERIHQSGINSIDLWQDDSSKVLIGSGGDDTAIKITRLDLSNFEIEIIAEKNTAHASAIVGIKFLTIDVLVSLSKDQRLIVWKVNYEAKIINPLKVIFTNVADAASLDVEKLSNDIYRLSMVGVGAEILELKLS